MQLDRVDNKSRVGTAKYTTYAIEQKVVTCGDVPLTALFAVLMFFMFMFTLIISVNINNKSYFSSTLSHANCSLKNLIFFSLLTFNCM